MLQVSVVSGLAIAATFGFLVGRRSQCLCKGAASDGGARPSGAGQPATQLDDALAAQLELFTRYDLRFSIALFGVDGFSNGRTAETPRTGRETCEKLLSLLKGSVRETDLVARHGNWETAVVMPQTELEGAAVFAERLRSVLEEGLPFTVSGGVAESLDGDTVETLLARANEALQNAKAIGGNHVFRHDGENSEPVLEPVPAGA
ncbi:MAG: GGDEF domain-containing protein [Planctomycetota bacterium]